MVEGGTLKNNTLSRALVRCKAYHGCHKTEVMGSTPSTTIPVSSRSNNFSAGNALGKIIKCKIKSWGT